MSGAGPASVGDAGPAAPSPSWPETSLADTLKLEPPTNDVEICCRFEDIATEGHAFYARQQYAEAKEHYNALLFLAGQLKT